LEKEVGIEPRGCQRCLLPNNISGIDLNSQEICNLCTEFQQPEYLGEERLREIFAEKPKGEYDCAVPLSGGRDSTYVLYNAKRVLELNPLAVNFDNGFATPQAVENIQNTCQALGVALVRIPAPNNRVKRIMANHMRAMIPYGPGMTLKGLCGPCARGGRAVVYKVALEKEIPVVLFGASRDEQVDALFDIKERLTRKQKLFSRKAPYFIRGLYNKVMFRKELKLPKDLAQAIRREALMSGEGESLEGGVRVVNYYHYMEWNRNRMKETIERELGWKKPEGRISSWRFDCKITELVSYLWVKHYGIPKDAVGYASMIRTGNMTREEALYQLENIGFGEYTPSLHDLFKNEMGLSEKEIETIQSW
jgi:tRNA(Ile)-lysidine synthase TilS/MesJ